MEVWFDKYIAKYGAGGFTTLVVGAIVAAAFGFTGLMVGVDYMTKDSRRPQLADPNKLEVIAQDIDENGQKEPLIKYDGKTYVLELNGNRKPELHQYKVKPATETRVIPGKPAKIEFID